MIRSCIGALSLFQTLAGAALGLLAANLVGPTRAESYQPKSNVTRGIYADLGQSMQSGIWRLSGSAAKIVDNASHTGRSLLAINWDQRPRSVCLRNDPGFDGPAREAYCLGPDGRWSPWRGSFRPELRLAPQEALVALLKP
jgi:hypothetical protein